MTDKVTPYEDGSSKKDQIRNMFDKVAWRYDALNRFLSLGIDVQWRKKLIKKLRSYSPTHVLDMATGTADLAVMAAKTIPKLNVTGIDLSPNMVELGKKKVIDKQISDRVTLEVGDSEDIQYSDDHFDGAMVAFGVRNYENLDKGLSELHRVLEPGAPLLILEFSKPTIFPIKQVFNLYFSTLLPLIGKVFSRDNKAYKYLYESVQAFPDYDKMTERMQQAGFKECKWESYSFGICCLYHGIK